ncbi:MAG: adenine deaminase [Synergistaceae bacterium]|jgi:adenine deaminase|nr:adenine deaminase [Synergistaceae bacterium]
MKSVLAAARGDSPCDLLIRGGRIANVLSMEYEASDIAIKDGIIAGVGTGYEGREVVDASGAVLMPGMIDGHIHIESTMLAPAAFAAAVVPLGTTTVMSDPHEIANTCGLPGIEFMKRESMRTPLDVFLGAPSCVPASGFETPREEIDAYRIMDCYDRGLCAHLAEMMNFPGVISGDESVWAKITGARGMVRTGHAPGVRGKDLCAYLISGCDSDHEIDFAEEALEKLRRGMWIMMREGTAEHSLTNLLPIILEDEARFARCMVVSDDITAGNILSEGHMDHKVRTMIGAGIRPLIAAAMVTANPAAYFRLWDRGAIAPGRIADIVMVPSLEECRAIKVWKRGILAAEDGSALFGTFAPMATDLPATGTIDPPPDKSSFLVPVQPGRDIRVIVALEGRVVTEQMTAEPLVQDGFVVSDCERDILKVVVTEKNRGSARTAVGFVRGFGLKRGALASSVAHDAHNYIAVGTDDESIWTAMKYLAENRGGMVVSDGDRIVSSLSLPIGGLMSNMNPTALSDAIQRMSRAAADLGAVMPQPFMNMSFLSLSVIPELKLTDQGYVNAAEGRLLELFV